MNPSSNSLLTEFANFRSHEGSQLRVRLEITHPIPDHSDNMIKFIAIHMYTMFVSNIKIFEGIKEGSAPNIETYVARFVEVSTLLP